uniref:Peptidase A1 domain-containing protein n=1 Tax=Oryza barthii TaxID=65489 RepID=A0A0D3FGS4_9ORYZ
MEASLVLLCLCVFLASGGEGRSPAGTVLPLQVRVQEVELEAPAANRLRFRHNVSLTVPVAVGTPPQNVTMVLDTGSELSWLLCNGSYAPPLTPTFNASGSSSYGAVPCPSTACEWRGRDLPVPPFCDTPPSNACRVSLSYADASSADGVLATDTFLLTGGAPPVALEGIRVGCALLPIPKSVLTPDHTGAGQTMVDSGTQFTFLLADAYAALKAEFTSQARLLLAPLGEPGFVFQGAFDACFRGPEARVAVWCLTFGNSDMAGMSAYVIGHHHQQNVWVEYDLQNGRVGFAPARCDLATQRLGAGA